LAPSVSRKSTVCTSGRGAAGGFGAVPSSLSGSLMPLKTRSELLGALSSSTLLAGLLHDVFTVAIAPTQSRLTLTFSSKGSHHQVVFDLNTPEQAMFWEELMYAEALISSLTSPAMQQLTDDSTPDFFAFSFTSLTGLVEKYGRMSGEVVGALRVLGASVPVLLRRAASAWDNEVVEHVVLLGSHSSVLHPVDHRALFAHLHRLLPNLRDLETYYPSIYLDDETVNDDARLREVCRVLSVELVHSGVKVECPSVKRAVIVPDKAEPHYPVSFSTLMFELQSSTYSSSSTLPNAVKSYQIKLWVSIVLALLVFLIIYSIIYMSFKKDTLLYSTFNPNWEERKRR